MAGEREIVLDVAKKTGLVKHYSDPDEQRNKIAEFTRRAAWALRGLGWGNISKPHGNNVRGLSVDAVIHAGTGAVADIVGNSDGDDPKPMWLAKAAIDPALYVAPLPEPPIAEPPTTPSEPGGLPDDEAKFWEMVGRFADEMTQLVEAVGNMADVCERVAERMDSLEKNGIKVNIGL